MTRKTRSDARPNLVSNLVSRSDTDTKLDETKAEMLKKREATMQKIKKHTMENIPTYKEIYDVKDIMFKFFNDEGGLYEWNAYEKMLQDLGSLVTKKDLQTADMESNKWVQLLKKIITTGDKFRKNPKGRWAVNEDRMNLERAIEAQLTQETLNHVWRQGGERTPNPKVWAKDIDDRVPLRTLNTGMMMSFPDDAREKQLVKIDDIISYLDYYFHLPKE